MKPQMRAAHLALAELHVAQGERRVLEQSARVARLDANGQDSALAQELLKIFEVIQSVFIADRDRLLEESESSGQT